MSLMAGPDLNATVDANVQPYERGVERAQTVTRRWEADLAQLDADLRKLEKSLDDHATESLQRHNEALDETGRGMAIVGAATIAAVGLAVNEAVKWESAWAGVTKTVDGTGEEMAELEEDLRRLATTLPATHEEIAAVAEAAGQLGVERENVAAFTKTMIDLAETTDLTADGAATSIAQLMNIMQTAPEDVDRVGASLVALGNAGASTESQILGMAMRIAGAGAQIGLTEGELLALANALASVGIQVEAGGSAISTVMKKIQLDVSTGAARLTDIAEVAGMTREQFEQQWRSDPAAALNAFIVGLGDLEGKGQDAIAVLDDLEIKGIRESDALLRLAGAGDLLNESIELGNRSWRENSALLEEAAKRYDTTESKVQVARNQLRDAGIDIGTTLLPALAAVAGTLSDVIRTWQDLPEPLRNTLVMVGLISGALLLMGGGWAMARTRVQQFIATTAALEAGGLKTMRTGLGNVASFLTGPWGIAVAAAVTGLGYLAARQGEAKRDVEDLTATLDEQTGALTANSAEWVIRRMREAGAIGDAEKLGLGLGLVTDAMLRNKDAVAEVNGELDRFRFGAVPEGTTYEEWASLGEAAERLHDQIGDTNNVVAAGMSQWRQDNEIKKDSKVLTDDAAKAQQGATGAWEDGADAAGELTEEIKVLGEQLSEMSGDYLSERDAGRAVRDSLRGIREQLREYRKEHGDLDGAFKDGSKSADEFAASLDALAADYQNQIETTEKLYGSERRTRRVWRESREALIDMADQLGMTRKEAEDYATEILGTPRLVKTYFDAQTEDAENDVERLDRLLEQAARNRSARIDITTRLHGAGAQTLGGLQEGGGGAVTPSPRRGRGLQQADGGIVETYADGGFSSSGELVQRIPQLRTGGGTVQWNEPQTSWEAYISGKPGMGDRNRAVLLEAGRRLGMIDSRPSAAASPQIDYDRLAGALTALRPPQPLYGPVSMQPHNYSEFTRQMLADQQSAGLGGMPA